MCPSPIGYPDGAEAESGAEAEVARGEAVSDATEGIATDASAAVSGTDATGGAAT